MTTPNDTNEPSLASAGSHTPDITARLRRWVHSVDAVSASDLMDEAAGVIDKLRRRLRLSDAAVRSQPALTDEEREVFGVAISVMAGTVSPQVIGTMRGALERLG
jgi:hypothetical protein